MLTDDCLNGRTARTFGGGTVLAPSPIVCRQEEALRAVREDNEQVLSEEQERREAAVHGFGATADAASSYTPTADSAAPDTALDTNDAEKDIRRPAAVIGHDPLQVGRGSPSRVVADILDGELPIGTYAKLDTEGSGYTVDMVGSSRQEVHLRDTALWMDLGYGADVRHAEERRAAAQIRSEDDPILEASEDAKQHTRMSETERVKDVRARLEAARTKSRKIRILCLVRLVLASIGAVAAILYDSIPAISAGVSEAISPAAYPLFGLLWAVLIALPFLPRLFRGVLGLLRFAPTRYSLTALALLVTMAYTVLVAATGNVLPLLEAIPLCMLAITALAETFEAFGRELAVSVVSSGRAVYVLSDGETPAATALGVQPADELIPRKRPAPLTALRTTVVDHVFSRMKRYNPYMGRLNYLLPASLGLAIVVAGVSLLRGGDLLSDGVRLFVTVYLASLPAAYLVAMSLPLQLANRRMRARGCAVIGTAAPADYTRPRKVSCKCELLIPECEIIVAARRKEITLRDDDPTDTISWRRMANTLFHLLEMPLAVDVPLEDDSSPEALEHLHVEIAESDAHYMKVYLVDDNPENPKTTEIQLGSHEALSRHGVRLPKSSMESVYRKSEDSHVLYLAFDGCFRIAYAAEYRVDPAFLTVAKRLEECGMRPVMVSYDPMLTSLMLSESRFEALGNMEIVRPDYTDVAEKCASSGVVAAHGGRDLIYPLVACRRMLLSYRLASALAWMGYAVVGALAVVTVLMGRTDLLNAFWVSVACLSSAAVMALVSWLCVRRPPVKTHVVNLITRGTGCIKRFATKCFAPCFTKKK